MGEPAPTPHGVDVDDDIYLDIADRRCFEQATATSIEAVFIILRDSDMTCRQDPISWEKLHKLLVAPINRILGLVLDLHCMTVGAPPEFIATMVTLLGTTWGSHCCTFKVKEAKELTGKLNHILFSAPWLKKPPRQHLLLSHRGTAP
jgi:hypothetical protein